MLSEALGGTGKVILVRGANSNSVGNARADGFEAGLAEDIELVGEQQGDWSNAVAKQVAENKIQANLDVVGITYYNSRRLQRNLGVLTPMEKHVQYNTSNRHSTACRRSSIDICWSHVRTAWSTRMLPDVNASSSTK